MSTSPGFDSSPSLLIAAPPLPDGVAPLPKAFVSAWLTHLRFEWGEVTRGYRQQPVANDGLLFEEGQPAHSVYVVESGRIRLISDSVEGKRRHLMIVGPTGLVGDCGLLQSKSHVVSAEASTDAVVCAVPVAAMLAALYQAPALMRQHQALCSMRFRIMLQHLALQGADSAKRRVSHHLLGLMASYGKPHPAGTLISITFTKQEMGHICGLSRVSVSQIFGALEKDGIIAAVGRNVAIRDAARLASLAQN